MELKQTHNYDIYLYIIELDIEVMIRKNKIIYCVLLKTIFTTRKTFEMLLMHLRSLKLEIFAQNWTCSGWKLQTGILLCHRYLMNIVTVVDY